MNKGKGVHMTDKIRISAYYNGIYTDGSDGSLKIRYAAEACDENFCEYHAEVTNCTDSDLYLEKVCLLDVMSPAELGIGEGPYTVFRSGRHKNDMPGEFVTGCRDERLNDVSSVMAETGGSLESGSGKSAVSDHLTLLKDAEGKVLALEFITGRDQLFQTVIELDDDGCIKRIKAETIFRIFIKPGQTVRTETLRTALTEDPEEEILSFARRKAALYGSRSQRHPAVFCTWYYYGLTVSYEDVCTCLNIIRDRRLPYDVFQVDEGWEVTLGEYVPNSRFPLSMKELADQIRNAGYTPGLWSSPFVAHETAGIWKKHPEWILRDRSGEPCLFPMNDTVYYVFDITNQETYRYFTELYQMFTDEWGYSYHKLDFTRAAVIFEDADFHDKTVTLAQAYYRAVSAVRRGMGEESFFLMCGGLYDPVIGLVDGQRTGSDVLAMWSSSVNQGGKTAPYTIRQSIQRFYMNEWWANDPDALMIRRNHVMERNLRLTYGLLNDDEIRTSLINQFAAGGIMCQTEPMDRITDDRLLEIRHILPVTEVKARPLDLMAGKRFPEAVDVYVGKTGVHCICLINWSDTDPLQVRLDLSKLSLPEGEYAVCDFYGKKYCLGVKADGIAELGMISPHGATVIKVERMADRPVITASDSHYSMGAECTVLDVDEGILRIKKKRILPVADRYTVWLPGEWHMNGKKTVEAVIEADQSEFELRLETGSGIDASY